MTARQRKRQAARRRTAARSATVQARVARIEVTPEQQRQGMRGLLARAFG